MLKKSLAALAAATALSNPLALLAEGMAIAAVDDLTTIYRLAQHNDPSLQAAEANYRVSQEIRAQAVSQLFPQIVGSGSHSETKKQDHLSSGVETREETTNYSVSLTQNIFNMPAVYAYRQSGALAQQGELQYAIDRQALIVRSAEAYFDVLRGGDNLASAVAEERAIAQQLQQTQQRYDVGLIAVTEVHEARAAHDLATASRLTAEVELGIAKQMLSALTDRQHGALATLTADFPVAPPTPENIESWIDYTTEHNLSIQLAEQVARAAEHNVSVKKSAYLPTLQGRWMYSDYQQDSGSSGSLTRKSDRESNEVEVTLTVPIFSGGLRRVEQRQAGYERVREQANLVATKRNALRQTRSSYLMAATDTAKARARQQGITSAQSALQATQAGYDAGTRNIVDLLNAQRDLFRAERDYANTRYDYVINSLKLKAAAGILNEKDIDNLNRWLTAQ